MLAQHLHFLFLIFGVSMACLFAGCGAFFLAWILSRKNNPQEGGMGRDR